MSAIHSGMARHKWTYLIQQQGGKCSLENQKTIQQIAEHTPEAECNRLLGCSYMSGIQHHITVDIILLSFTCLFQEAPCRNIFSLKKTLWELISC